MLPYTFSKSHHRKGITLTVRKWHFRKSHTILSKKNIALHFAQWRVFCTFAEKNNDDGKG